MSGGEAQRIKLVTELTKVRDEVGRRGQKAPHTFYVLDEPTVGLHMADVDKLIRPRAWCRAARTPAWRWDRCWRAERAVCRPFFARLQPVFFGGWRSLKVGVRKT